MLSSLLLVWLIIFIVLEVSYRILKVRRDVPAGSTTKQSQLSTLSALPSARRSDKVLAFAVLFGPSVVAFRAPELVSWLYTDENAVFLGMSWGMGLMLLVVCSWGLLSSLLMICFVKSPRQAPSRQWLSMPAYLKILSRTWGIAGFLIALSISSVYRVSPDGLLYRGPVDPDEHLFRWRDMARVEVTVRRIPQRNRDCIDIQVDLLTKEPRRLGLLGGANDDVDKCGLGVKNVEGIGEFLAILRERSIPVVLNPISPSAEALLGQHSGAVRDLVEELR
jgi:hypothetical protein